MCGLGLILFLFLLVFFFTILLSHMNYIQNMNCLAVLKIGLFRLLNVHFRVKWFNSAVSKAIERFVSTALGKGYYYLLSFFWVTAGYRVF